MAANGNADPFISAGQIAAFRPEMIAVGQEYTFTSNPAAKYILTNPGADHVVSSLVCHLPVNNTADATFRLPILNYFGVVFILCAAMIYMPALFARLVASE
jgi:hypothetical protein